MTTQATVPVQTSGRHNEVVFDNGANEGLFRELIRRENAKRDFLIDPKDSGRFHFEAYRGEVGQDPTQPVTLYLGLDPETDTNDMNMPLTNHAHGQIAERLGIPRKYYDRMLSDDPQLLAYNVNRWMEKEKGTLLLRTLDGNARALLSDRYRPLDNFDLIQAVTPSIAAANAEGLQVEVQQSAITDVKLYLRLLSRRLTGDVKVGQTVQYGVQISNSEVGNGALSLEEFIYTLQCRNGMVVSKAIRRAHVGGSLGWGDEDGSVREFFTNETRQLDDAATFSKIRDVMRGLLTPDNFGRQLRRLQDATERKIEGSVQKAIEVTGRTFNLQGHETEAMLKNLIEGGDLSAWGLSSAVTLMAQGAGSFDRRVELERVGNAIIELPKSDWQAITGQV